MKRLTPDETTLDYLLHDERARTSNFAEIEFYLADDGTLVEWLEDRPVRLPRDEDALIRGVMAMLDAVDKPSDSANSVLDAVGHRFYCADYDRFIATYGEDKATRDVKYIPVYSIERGFIEDWMEERNVEERNGLAT